MRELGAAGNRTAPPGTKEWALAVRLDIQANLHQWSDDVKTVKAFIDLIVKHDGWRVLEDRKGRPFSSFADFCKEREPYGLGHDPDLIDAIKGAPNGTTIRAALRSKPGRPSKSESLTNNDSNENQIRGGTNRDYTVARLDRDAPELAERVRAGELSANAAAIEAGFRKRPTALALLRAAWRKATKAEREAFLEEVG